MRRLALSALGLLALLPLLAVAKVGRTKLSSDGLETSAMALGGLHFAELDGACAIVCGLCVATYCWARGLLGAGRP